MTKFNEQKYSNTGAIIAHKTRTKPTQKMQLPAVMPGAALCNIDSDKSNYTGGLLQCQRLSEGIRIMGIGYVPQACMRGSLMPTSRTDVRVKCPFYQYDDSISKGGIQRIVCEGIVPGSVLMSCYKTKKDRNIQLDTFCCEYFDRCEIYRMLMDAKYTDE